MEAEIKIRVRYDETDCMKYVYHGNYAAYYHACRTELLREIGLCDKTLEKQDVILPIIEMHINYNKPAFYDDNLEIEVTPCDWGHSRLAFRYAIFRKGEPEPLCTGKTSHCFTDGKGKIKRMPEGLKQRLDNLEIN